MPARERPQIYLVTPPAFEAEAFLPRLAAALDAAPVACLRLGLATRDETQVMRAADAVREIAHPRDVPLVIEGHPGLVERLGLDGVHLLDAARSVRSVRKALGADAIIGAFCGTSRHEGLAAAEAGADYVAFGPARPSALGTGGHAETDLFAWWSEMIEVPVVAEGNIDEAALRELAELADFIAFREEVWDAPDPVDALRSLAALLA